MAVSRKPEGAAQGHENANKGWVESAERQVRVLERERKEEKLKNKYKA